MKRLFCFLFCIVIVVSISVVAAAEPVTVEDIPAAYAAAPPSGSEFQDLAYYDISSNLGDLRLYLPYGMDLNSLQLSGDKLYNVTNSTIYLYCPQFPDATFQASRFQNVTYRLYGNNMQTSDLTGIRIVEENVTFDYLVPVILVFCVVCILFFVMWRRRNE